MLEEKYPSIEFFLFLSNIILLLMSPKPRPSPPRPRHRHRRRRCCSSYISCHGVVAAVVVVGMSPDCLRRRPPAGGGGGAAAPSMDGSNGMNVDDLTFSLLISWQYQI